MRHDARVREPVPAVVRGLSLPKNQRQRRCCGDHVPASNSLNEPRTVPNCLASLGKRRAKRSRKVLRSQKRSPAPAATERRAKGKSSQAGTTRAALRSQARERHFFWITHGHTNVGFVSQVGSEFTARDADGRKIGLFASLKAAAGAVDRHGGAS